MAKKRWSELSKTQQTAIIVIGTAEVVMTTIALVDLARRPPENVRGKKAVWALVSFVQPLGPIAYLTLGRKRSPSETAPTA
jgi:hypothetical protein